MSEATRAGATSRGRAGAFGARRRRGAGARSRRRLGAALLPLALGACAGLEPIERDVCGNGVVERGEDCDRFAGAEGASCRPPSAGEAACRYECAPAGAEGPPCPEGYGCGVDRTCRRPSGSFAPGVERASEAASALRVADFDGDGRGDVLALGAANDRGERSARVLFRDAQGFGATEPVPNVFRSVALGPLGQGAAQGLAIVSGQGSLVGVDLLVGDRDRRFAPVVSPVIGGAAVAGTARLLGVDALPRRFEPGETGAMVEFNHGDEVVLLLPALGASGATLFGLVASPKELLAAPPRPPPPAVALLTLGAEAGEQAGGLASGRFRGPAVGPPCEDVAWAPPGFGEIYLFVPCRDAGGGRFVWNEDGAEGRVEPARVRLPEGARVVAGPGRWLFVADADGDGVSDLAVMTDRGPFLALGEADGSPPVAASLGLGPEKALRGFGDLNGDGVPDWVFADSVVLSEPGVPLGVERVRAPAPWAEAVVADFNADGRLDVMAVGPASRSLDYYLGGGQGLFNRVGAPVAGVASQLTSGDFDGDSVVDVAFALGAEGGAPPDSIFIAFGSGASATPPPPSRVGELRGVRQIIAGSYAFGGADLDGADDLGLMAASEGGEGVAALLFGNAGRQLRSPLVVTVDVNLRPWAVAAGRFVAGERGGPAPLGLAMLVGERLVPDQPYSLWLSSPSERGATRFPPPAGVADPAAQGVSTTLPAEVDPAPLHGEAVDEAAGELPELLAADLDVDGLDEAAVLVPQRQGGAALVVARARAEGGLPMLFAGPALPGLPRSRQAGFADLDGDRAPDLVVLSPPGEGGGANLAVYWNAGGAFDPGGALTRVELPGGAASAWSAAPAPAGARLFAVNGAGVYAVGFRADRSARVEALEGLEGGEAIAAGDVTGDGVVDLVVGDARSLRVVRGEPVLP
ncbi:MAG TPA: VCBS repeat-containing protein [Polyangiaceae bacterium]|nr:VCBS repeat-containing protein [Polyangiaceae bacterium]